MKTSVALALIIGISLGAGCSRTRAKAGASETPAAPTEAPAAPTNAEPVEKKASETQVEAEINDAAKAPRIEIGAASFSDPAARAKALKDEDAPINKVLALRQSDGELRLFSLRATVDTSTVVARIALNEKSGSDWHLALTSATASDATTLWKTLDKGSVSVECSKAMIDEAKKLVTCTEFKLSKVK